VDECWLLIAGYVGPSPREDAQEDFGDYIIEDFGEDTRSSESSDGERLSAHASAAIRATTIVRVEVRGRKTTSVMRSAVPLFCVRRGRSAWWRCERRWIRGGASRCFRMDCWRFAWAKQDWKRPFPAWRKGSLLIAEDFS